MDFLIPSKKVSKCPDCNGSGYLPLKDKTLSQNGKYSIEIGCKRCEGHTGRVDRLYRGGQPDGLTCKSPPAGRCRGAFYNPYLL